MTGVPDRVPRLTACSLCVGETLADRDPAPGGQLRRLRAIADAGVARLTLVECLDECERGDVVVARAGADSPWFSPPAWFAGLAGEELTDALRGWLRAGGPGLASLPGSLEVLRLERLTTPEA